MKKAIITCAVTGAETTRDNNPHLPISPQEIAQAAEEVTSAGAAILHLHVRHSDGTPTQDTEIFSEAINLIRARTDIVIEVTTGGAVGMDMKERMQPLSLNPEMASLDCGSINFGDEYIINTIPMIRECALEMKERGIKPTLECFDVSHIDTALLLIDEGLVDPPYYFGLVVDVPGGLKYNEDTLKFLISRLPKNSYWTAIPIGGKAALPVARFAAANGGGFMRTGFEDNVWYEKGVLAQSNAQLVEQLATIAQNAGRKLASPDDVRKLFGLRK
jgi:3-keto-5-aminohexanoate cleavage enzyme